VRGTRASKRKWGTERVTRVEDPEGCMMRSVKIKDDNRSLGPSAPCVATKHGALSSHADLMRSLSFSLIGIRLNPSLL
jgi:hypothetical protein